MPTDYLIECLNLVLKGNIFLFNEEYFIQKIGTAMGTKCAPSYACIFMGQIEEEFLKKWKGTQPELWKRYIDDIFMLWKGSEQELNLFLEEINSHHSHIKFTANYDSVNKTVPFLDMQVSIDEKGFIQTDLYKKDTAKCQYLLPSSCHPSHVTRNIPYSLGYRLLRICSIPEDFNKRLVELKEDLISRGYKSKIIDEAFQKVRKINRKKAIEKVHTETKKKTPLVTQYHPNLPSVSKILKKHWEVMTKEDPRMKRIFPEPSTVAYKRAKNLKDLLVKAKVSTKRKSTRKLNGYHRCGRGFFNQCVTCSLIPEKGIKTHKCMRDNKIYQITNPVTCLSTNVIYKITCKKARCDFVYIGQTNRRFADRFTDHKTYVSTKDLQQVCGAHFNKPGHSKSDMNPAILEQVYPKNDPFVLDLREKYWINKYQSLEYGANRKT